MKAGPDCIDLIEHFEGFRAKPYKCPAGVWTIGLGSTRYPDGRRVAPSDVEITLAKAREIVAATLATEYEPAVNRYVQVPLTQNEFDALVDFAYNCGAQNLRNSTLLRLINNNQKMTASMEFIKWVRAGDTVLPGLVKRRNAETALFRGLPWRT